MTKDNNNGVTRRKLLGSGISLAGAGSVLPGLATGKDREKRTQTRVIETSLVYNGLPEKPASSGDPFRPYTINGKEKKLTLHRLTPAEIKQPLLNNQASVVTPSRAHGPGYKQSGVRSRTLAKTTGFRNQIDQAVSLVKPHPLPYVNINVFKDGRAKVHAKSEKMTVPPDEKKSMELEPEEVELKVFSEEVRERKVKKNGTELEVKYNPLQTQVFEVTPTITLNNNGLLDVHEVDK